MRRLRGRLLAGNRRIFHRKVQGGRKSRRSGASNSFFPAQQFPAARHGLGGNSPLQHETGPKGLVRRPCAVSTSGAPHGNPKTLLPPVTDGNRHPRKGWRKLGNLLAKTTYPGKTRSGPCSARGGFQLEDDLDYSPSVTSVPEQDKPGLLQPQSAKRSDTSVSRNVCDSGPSTVTH